MKTTTAAAAFIAAAVAASNKRATVKTITRDVAIIGGGASGAYSAVRLREDFGVSILLIEKDDRLVSILRVPFPILTQLLCTLIKI